MTTKPPFQPHMKDISDFNDRSDKYSEYVRTMQKNRFTTGHDIIDKSIRGIGPGEMMIIGAYSGTFKSAYLQNLLIDYSCRSDLYSLFFTLEMPDEKVFEREMQITNGITGSEVEYRYKNVSLKTNELRQQCAASGSDKVLTVERPRLTLDHISEYIEIAKTKYQIGVVGIDYLGLMKGNQGRTTADLTEDMSNGAKELAKSSKVPVILLTQINRAAAKAQVDEGMEIELHHLKYGGEAGADIVLGLYKDHETTLVMKVLKNRGGEVGIKFKANIIPHALKFEGFEQYVAPPKKNGNTKTVTPLPFL